MKGWFTIAVEKDRQLVRVTMGGFFDGPTVMALRSALVEAVGTLCCAPNEHVTLCDIREMDIQSQERVGEFSKLVGSDDIRSRKLAFVTAKSLARLQARRLTSREGVEFFSEVDPAVTWLTA